MTAGRRRLTKREWLALGGLRNSALFRVQSPSGRWRYYLAT
jgi:hypothetical protein